MAMTRRPAAELLEDRTAPATFGVAWPDAAHLTLSFARDDTPAGTGLSALFQALEAWPSAAAWQREVARAFQTWAVRGNLNVGVVADSGQAFGTAGPVQGDGRFGDIRVAAVPLAPEAVGFALPFDVTLGTWAGDVVLNSLYDFSPESHYDLFSVLLHEAGHALGLPESTVVDSVMYEVFLGRRDGLAPSDVTAIRALYGARQHDQFDAESRNDTRDRATRIRLDDDAAIGVAEADITTHADVDWYRFRPETTGGITVRLRTSGVSLLMGRLTVYDAAGHAIATTAAVDPLGEDLSLRLEDVQPGASYYVKVESGAPDVFGIGGYRLEVRPDTAGSDDSGLVLPGFVNNDRNTNDTRNRATDARQTYFQTDARFDYAYPASIHNSIDVDFYRLRSPNAPGGTTQVLTALAWAQPAAGLEPRLRVFNEQGNPVAAEVLVNEDGSYTIQVSGTAPNRDYYLEVRPAHPVAVGNYFVGVDFALRGVALQDFAGGNLEGLVPEGFHALRVTRDQLLHFVLSASGVTPPGTFLRLAVHDEAGRVVFNRVFEAGEARSLTLFLGPGTYVFRVAAAARDGSAVSLLYRLRGISSGGPIGPEPVDTTFAPTGSSPAPDETDLDYLWLEEYDYLTFLILAESLSDLWWE